MHVVQAGHEIAPPALHDPAASGRRPGEDRANAPARDRYRAVRQDMVAVHRDDVDVRDRERAAGGCREGRGEQNRGGGKDGADWKHVSVSGGTANT